MSFGMCGNWRKDKRDGVRRLIVGSGEHLHTGEKLTYYYGEGKSVIAIPTSEYEEFFEVSGE